MAKRAYIGISDIARKIKSMYFGAQIDVNSKNLVGNGGFDTGSTGWTSLYPDVSFVSNTGGYSGYCTRLSIASEPAYPNNNVVLYYFDNTKLFVEGHIYYVSCMCKASSEMSVILAINDVDSLSRYWLAYSGSKTIGTSWSLVSARGTAKVMNATADKPYVGFMLRDIVASGSVYLDEVKVFDLTAMFGAGNEPSQAVCDTCLPYGVVLDKARKIKKGYIGINGIAHQFYSTQTLKGFSTCPFPNFTANTATNEYGTWTASASSISSSSYPAYKAFDSDTSSMWYSSDLSLGDTAYVQLNFPAGVRINPTKATITYRRFGSGSCVQGYDPDTGEWVRLGNTGHVANSSYTETHTYSSAIYFSAIRAYATRYSGSYPDPIVLDLKITAGTLKIE